MKIFFLLTYTLFFCAPCVRGDEVPPDEPKATILYKVAPGSMKKLEEMSAFPIGNLDEYGRKISDSTSSKHPKPYIEIGKTHIHWLTSERDETWYRLRESDGVFIVYSKDKPVKNEYSLGLIVLVLLFGVFFTGLSLTKAERFFDKLFVAFVMSLVSYYVYAHIDWTILIMSTCSVPFLRMILTFWKFLEKKTTSWKTTFFSRRPSGVTSD